MRRLFVAFGLMGGLLSPAFAADYDLPVLRGSEPVAPVMTVGPATFTRWSGFYVGGDFSYNNANVDFSGATGSLVQSALQFTAIQQALTPSQWGVLGKGADSAFGGGAFLGYNTQWQDLILGVEANYTHTNLSVTAPFFQIGGRNDAAGDVVTINNAAGHLVLTDYAEARGRAGYIVGNLLPYGFVGFVVGLGDYNVSISGQCTAGGPASLCPGSPSFSNSAGQNNALLWGVSVGGGLDWALTQNFFLRGEFEFIQFMPIANINVPVVSGRLGAGFKF